MLRANGEYAWIESAGTPLIEDTVFVGFMGTAMDVTERRNRLFMGYDDPRAVLRKGAFVRSEGLAGVFAWELSQDNGDILNAMNFGVGNLLLRP